MRTLTECIEKLEELTADDAVNDIREAHAVRDALNDLIEDMRDIIADFNEVADCMDELL